MSKKCIVITGVTSGIGKALTNLFSKDYKVFAGYRNSDLIEHDDNVDYFYIDLTDKESIAGAAEYIKSKVDKIDILINVAGGVVAGPVELLDIDKLRQQFEINTFSHLEFSQKLLSIMDNGRIINISSMSSFGHFPFISPYCASKRAMDILFNALALENHRNIKVISIKPGVIATPIWEKSVKNNLASLEMSNGYEAELEFLKNNALKNSTKGLDVNTVAEKIKNIAFKAHPKSSYVIGKDACFAQVISIFPQDIINYLVKIGMLIKINNNSK